jgi:chromosome segregation protein
VHFTKIRVSGFKSFIDPTDLPIGPGVTGIVGPNGCGKSNIVEALRWAMGESSAKRMRGGEMDDVIFGGTDSRPARNLAEVVLHLDNADHAAPPPFNETDEIEISRRIERGGGSTYRINGKEVRARDVQLLFADLATGAHSTAMVSQGRVGALIGAKPVERRVLLEEAAGIRGLHSRRHEAELRLKAAESNLERLEDIVGALEGQYQGLQRQVRQATRYRRLAENIRRHDGMLMHLKWLVTSAAQESAQSELDQSAAAVAERTIAASSAATEQANAAAKLPALRLAETDAATELQRLVLLVAELDRETERMAQARDEAGRQVQQISADLDRERILESDAAVALERLELELGQVSGTGDSEDKARQAAQASCDAAIEELGIKDTELTTLTKYVAEIAAQRALLEQRLNDFTQRQARLDARCGDLQQQREDLTAGGGENIDLVQAEEEVRTAEMALTKSRDDVELAENEHAQEVEKEAKARSLLSEVEAEVARLEAEAKALAELTEPPEGDLFAPLIDSIKVEPGYEIALGAALGDDLNAPSDTAAPVHWAALPPLDFMQPLPADVESLSSFVDAPAALTRRLEQIGVVTATAAGEILRDTLKPGQRIVSLDGTLWRWDGYTVASGATTTAATRLAQKNRLSEVRQLLETVKFNAAKRVSEFQAASAANSAVAARERQARESVAQSFAKLDVAREAYSRLTSHAAAANARIANIQEALDQAQSEIAELKKGMEETTAAVSALEDMSGADDRSAVLRNEIQALRAIEAQRREELGRLVHEAETRAARLASNEAEALQWTERAKRAHQRISELESRLAIAETDSKRLAGRPDEIKEQRNLLLEQTNMCERKRNHAADELAEAESLLTAADSTARRADLQLAESRETQVRAEAQFEQATRECDAVAAAIGEALECAPEAILDKIGVDSDSILDAEALELRLDRLKRERDNMGPVNLRAESEAETLEEQVQSMRSEREELLAAISRLRQGIAALNREGRERLRAAFTSVNEHFQDLFVRLFGGGRAYLTLTENDDPLEAGLEIMASPPGKKLQVLSLLSGGEQALTALSLLFAVFLTNPAPICVLDEIDAPLDDANVDRVCSLLAEIAAPGRVRFLVVTHHRMTMSRVDRLFGVTMGERGVSQLVSVDLSGAEALRQSA